jgi:hypothetical protein
LYPDRAGDQATRSAAALFRRYARKLKPQKPRIIMAQVDGSGTAEIADELPIPSLISRENRLPPKVGPIKIYGSADAKTVPEIVARAVADQNEWRPFRRMCERATLALRVDQSD